MSEPNDAHDPRASRLNALLGPLVLGQMGSVFDRSGGDLVLESVDGVCWDA